LCDTLTSPLMGGKEEKRENWAGLLWCNEASRKQIGMRREEEDPPPGRVAAAAVSMRDTTGLNGSAPPLPPEAPFFWYIPSPGVAYSVKEKESSAQLGATTSCAVTRRIILLGKRS
jgi:hypothetical protein